MWTRQLNYPRAKHESLSDGLETYLSYARQLFEHT